MHHKHEQMNEELKAKSEAAVAAAIAEGKSQEEANAIGAEILKGGQDPVKNELERLNNRPTRTKKEKLLFKRNLINKELGELGVDPDDIDNGDNSGDSDDTVDPLSLKDDSKPLTVGMLKQIQKAGAVKTSLQLADEIENEAERELAKYHIKNTIRSTGIPAKDLELAMVHVNALKNTRVVEELGRKPEANRGSSAGGSGGPRQIVEEELTPEEISFTRPPFNLTKKEILAARPKA